MNRYEILDNRAIFEVSGKDKFSFLQGLITNDIELVKQNKLIYSLILTPQGKFLFEIFIYYLNKKLYIECLSDKSDDLLGFFNKYKLRSEISLDRVKDFEIVVFDLLDDQYIGEVIISKTEPVIDPRWHKIGYRALVKIDYLEKLSGIISKEEFYYSRLCNQAIPQGHLDMQDSKSFPMNFGMDKLSAISFTKGCFIGQELTARMKHRNMVRKQIFKIISENDLNEVKQGEAIKSSGKEIGEFLSGYNKFGLCLLKIEEFAAIDQNENPLMLCQQRVSIETPEWI